jgi:hypothetical protein
MKLASDIYFYEGDYFRGERLYHGVGSSNLVILDGDEPVMIDGGAS